MDKTGQANAKELLRQKAYESLEIYGPDMVCIFMNTEGRIMWELEYGDCLDPGVEGVPLVDDFRHPSNRINMVYQQDYYAWEKRARGLEGEAA